MSYEGDGRKITPPPQYVATNNIPRQYSKDIDGIARAASRLTNGVLPELAERESGIQQAFAVSRDGLPDVLLSPELRQQATTYCAGGAQIRQSVKGIEAQFDTIAGKFKKAMPKDIGRYLGAVADYLYALDANDPLATLDPPIDELLGAKFSRYGFSAPGMDRQHADIIAAQYSRIGENFSRGYTYQDNVLVAFLTELGIHRHAVAETQEQKAAFRTAKIDDSAQAVLNGAGLVVNQYFQHYADYLLARLYGKPTTTLQAKAFPDYGSTSALPLVLGVYLAEARGSEYRSILPTSFQAMLDDGLIPYLPDKAKDVVAIRHAKTFYEWNSDIRQWKRDASGLSPYEISERAYITGSAARYFGRLAVEFAGVQVPNRMHEWDMNRLAILGLLAGQVITLPGEGPIRQISVSATRTKLDMVVLGAGQGLDSGPEAFAVQIDGMGQVYGVPSSYGFAAQPFMSYLLNKMLEGWEAQQMPLLSEVELESVYDATHEKLGELRAKLPKRLTTEQQDRLNELADTIFVETYKKHALQKAVVSRVAPGAVHEGDALIERPVPAFRFASQRSPGTEKILSEREQRFEISIWQRVQGELTLDLATKVQRAVDTVAYSQVGSMSMRKLTGIGERYFRIASGRLRVFLVQDPKIERNFTVIGVDDARDDRTYDYARRVYEAYMTWLSKQENTGDKK